MKFLLNSITENPFVISSLSSSQDSVDSSTRKPLIVIYQGVASPVESQHFTALENLLNKRFEIVKAGDATDIDISNMSTLNELKSTWNSEILGDSPYGN